MSKSQIRLMQGDCLELMGQMSIGSVSDGVVDCIITDPAYWTLNKWREIGTTTRLGGHRDADQREGWFDTIDETDLWEMLCTFGTLLPKNGHAWIMCDHETLPYILNYIRLDKDDSDRPTTQFNYCKPYPVLKMTNDGKAYKQGMGYHGRCCHEYVVLCEKGRRRFNDENWPDVFSYAWTGYSETAGMLPGGKPFPTAKPVALVERLIELSTDEGQVVLDPFMGSGATGVACINTGRDFVGIEKSPAYFEAAKRRLEAAQNAPTQAAFVASAEAGRG
jgi:site-specific DNA-methyltransferase (adenine-specific)